MCYRNLFIMHLEQLLADYVESETEIILNSDANKHAVKGELARQIQKLGLVKACINKFKSSGPTSCFRGRKQLDGIWNTRNIAPASFSTCTFNFGAGDHRFHVVNFQAKAF